MKNFWKRYSYTAMRLFLNQFAIALFGIGLAFACGRAGNQTLQLISSICSVVFYLFLLYAVMWETGAKDGITAVAHHTGRGLWRGFAVALIANIPNLILALLTVPGAFADAGSSAVGLGATVSVIALMLQGMYMGILALPFRGLVLHDFSWVFFAIIAPAIIVSGVAYILGSYNLHFTNILIQKNKDVKGNGRPH